MTSETAGETVSDLARARAQRELVFLGADVRGRATHRIHGVRRVLLVARPWVPWLAAVAFGVALRPWTWPGPSSWLLVIGVAAASGGAAAVVVLGRGRR